MSQQNEPDEQAPEVNRFMQFLSEQLNFVTYQPVRDVSEELIVKPGDHVFVSGSKIEGSGYVIAFITLEQGQLTAIPMNAINYCKANQSFPQVWINIHEGKSAGKNIHLNGEDLLAGKLEVLSRGNGIVPANAKELLQLELKNQLLWSEELRVIEVQSEPIMPVFMSAQNTDMGSDIVIGNKEFEIKLTLNKELSEELISALSFYTWTKKDPKNTDAAYGVPFLVPSKERVQGYKED